MREASKEPEMQRAKEPEAEVMEGPKEPEVREELEVRERESLAMEVKDPVSLVTEEGPPVQPAVLDTTSEQEAVSSYTGSYYVVRCL